MANFVNPDGSALVGGLLPNGIGEAIQFDNAGNLKTTSVGGGTSNVDVIDRIARLLGHVIIDSFGSTVDVSDRIARLLGHVITDNGSVVDVQDRAARLLGAITGVVTANAGTNLNTSALALEAGGNLAASKADLDTIVTQTLTPNISDRAARLLGHTVTDTGSVVDITDRIARLLGHVIIDSLPAITGTVTANAGTNLNTSALALEAGGNLATIVTQTLTPNMSDRAARLLGHTVTDTGSITDIQDRVARLLGHVIIDSLPAITGTVTANAGTNLNTSALALETGGNLAASKTDLDTIVTQTLTPNISDRAARQLGITSLATPVAANLVGGSSTANAATLLTIPAGKTFFGWLYVTASINNTAGAAGTPVGNASIATGGTGTATPSGTLLQVNVQAPASALNSIATIDRASGAIFMVINAATNPVTLVTAFTTTTTQNFSAAGYLQ